MKNKITFNEFLEIENKLEIKVGIIIDVERVPNSYGLKLTVQFAYGDENGDDVNYTKTAFTNLGKDYDPEDLMGIQCPFIMNLEPSEIKGVTSEVMIMVGDHHEFGSIISPSDYVYGTKLL